MILAEIGNNFRPRKYLQNVLTSKCVVFAILFLNFSLMFCLKSLQA